MTIANRLQYISINNLVVGLSEAIEDAKGMAGTLDPDDMKARRQELEALRQTVLFLFGKEPA